MSLILAVIKGKKKSQIIKEQQQEIETLRRIQWETANLCHQLMHLDGNKENTTKWSTQEWALPLDIIEDGNEISSYDWDNGRLSDLCLVITNDNRITMAQFELSWECDCWEYDDNCHCPTASCDKRKIVQRWCELDDVSLDEEQGDFDFEYSVPKGYIEVKARQILKTKTHGEIL